MKCFEGQIQCAAIAQIMKVFCYELSRAAQLASGTASLTIQSRCPGSERGFSKEFAAVIAQHIDLLIHASAYTVWVDRTIWPATNWVKTLFPEHHVSNSPIDGRAEDTYDT